MKYIYILVLIAFGIVYVTAQNQIEWRGDRTGIYKETGLLKSWPEGGPALAWHYNGLGEGHSSVAIANNQLYVTGLSEGKGYLYVFDLNGKLLKKKDYGIEWSESYNGARGTVNLNDGKIYIISGTGHIICLNEQSLDVVWQKDFLKEYKGENLRWGLNESPLVVDNKVIVTPGGETDNVVALDKNNGSLIWSSKGEGALSAYCSPIYLNDQQIPLIVVMTATHVLGIDAGTGDNVWTYPYSNDRKVHPNSPVYSDNRLLCTSGYGKGSLMLRLTNGGRNVEKVWETIDLETKTGGVVKIGDYVYGSGDKSKNWFCLDWKTGETKFKDNSLANGAIIAADGLLYCYTEKGEMALVKPNPAKLDIVSQFLITMGTDQHWAHPVIYKGVLYVRHGNTLMAYKIK